MPHGDGAVDGLLFTDLEGSTAHLHSLGDRYGAALARHHAILRRAVMAEGGRVVGSEGDSLAAVLPSPAAAIRAAVAAQRELAAEPWPDAPWLVRMAVHAGRVDTTGAVAAGISLHEAARIRDLAHGGQVVVSEHARAAVTEPIPAEIGLIDLGIHAVRDFAGEVRLHQVTAPGLEASFPPLRTAGTRSLPPDRTPFIGRADEVQEVGKLLEQTSVVTIVGPGGSGKTRLAYQAARRSPRDAVVAVELAGLQDPAQVAAAVLGATGAANAAELRRRDLLLVLDNCEHLIAAVADVVAALSGGDISILATSREALRVTGEAVWPVPVFDADEAVALFRDRAGVPVDDALVRVACDRLGSMPLAIELAAARVRAIPLDQLIARLDDQLGLLTRGPRDVPRQETMRATIDWSHDLLTDDEQLVFRRLAVFAGGFVLAAAEAVAGDEANTLDALAGMVSKSLVDLDASTGRYRMLEPVRQYAAERLRASGEEDLARERHVQWARQTSTAGSVQLFIDPPGGHATLTPERDNFAAAISWALDHDDLPSAVAIVVSMTWYWFTARLGDALMVLPRLLDRVEEMAPLDRAGVLRCAGMIYGDDSEDPRPLAWLLEAEAITRREGRERALGAALFWLGRTAAIHGRRDIAERALEESAAVHERLGDMFGWGWSQIWIAQFERFGGDLTATDARLDEVLIRAEGVPHAVGAALQEFAKNEIARGDLMAAARRAREAIELFRDLGDQWQTGMSETLRAEILLGTDDDEAAEATAAAIQVFREVEWDIHIARPFMLAVALLLRRDLPEEAATLAGAGEGATSEAFRDWWTPQMGDAVTSAKALIDDDSWRGAVERGRRRRPIEWADTAIAWLEQAYPAIVSTV